ncbi:MAG TPA: hypothetical protein VNI60_02715 [Pyrinomonadaceae bacterium]|nr:hypothetical protein [Pyrinomonadaceae bacterium]
MRRILVLSSLVFVVLATFSSFEIKAQTPPKALRSASTTLQLDGKNIKLETYAYVNVMPRVILPKEKQSLVDCSKSGRFIVITTISAADESPLPSGIKVNRVWVHHNGSWWEGVFNKDETTANKKTIRTVARDCPHKVLRGNGKVKVVVAVSHNGKAYYLLSTQEKLHSAS